MLDQQDIRFEAAGQWRGILMALGVDQKYLVNKHGPCPFCDGKDRFRWDNKGGEGTWICSQCGAGDGFSWAERITGKDFAGVVKEIREIIRGGIKQPKDHGPRKQTQAEIEANIKAVAGASQAIEAGDLVDRYLTSRGLGDTTYPSALRFVPALRDGEGGVRPCMVGVVRDVAGHVVTLHRTFLRSDGLAKAEGLDKGPRKLMPGNFPEGAAIRLSMFEGGPLGIAEGIETALAASILFEMPVWSAITARGMAKWTPPEGCTEVVIFGDHDASYTGQAAAYVLANRIATRTPKGGGPKPDVSVKLPPNLGDDWNDVLLCESQLHSQRGAR